MVPKERSKERSGVVLARWARDVERSALQEMLSAASGPDVISFALGKPATELFPVQEYRAAVEKVLDEDRNALQYGPPTERLKSQIVELMRQRGVECTEAQVFLTAGAQQGMNLLARLLLEHGGQVAVEQLAYTGFMQVIEPYEPSLLPIKTDAETGMDVDSLESALSSGARPALIYAIGDGHNPLGVRMDLERRGRLVEVAKRYRVPIMEDDPYGFLFYDRRPRPALRSFDDEWVLYVGSFSKLLAPALRVGWLVVPEELTIRLSIVKEASDIDTATFSQRCVSAYLAGAKIGEHLELLRREYSLRRSTMGTALKKHFPSDARWIEPSGGVFFWVELNSRIDTNELLKFALEQERVAFIPGTHFSVSDPSAGSSCVRLNFSYSSPSQIEEGIARLGRAIRTLSRNS